jgi:hypothetical protein
MLCQLTTVKARLGIDDFDVKNDSLLTNTIRAVSATFEKECNRQFGRTIDATQEFDANDTEIIMVTYPLETVTRFETKASESEGWIAEADVNYLIRRACVISLDHPFGSCRKLARVTYTGGYVLPGAIPGTGQTPLPDDLEQAAVEQVAAWFQNRDKLGLARYWPKGGVYLEFLKTDLLPNVQSTLDRYRRMCV